MTVALFSDPITIEVLGYPRPKGSKTAIVRNGKAILLEQKSSSARAAATSWRNAIEQAARDWQYEHRAQPCDMPVSVTVSFRLPRPPSAPKRRIWPDRKPDIDKLVRAVLDALIGTVLADDARVCELVARKRYAVDCLAGATITIEAMS